MPAELRSLGTRMIDTLSKRQGDRILRANLTQRGQHYGGLAVAGTWLSTACVIDIIPMDKQLHSVAAYESSSR